MSNISRNVAYLQLYEAKNISNESKENCGAALVGEFNRVI